MLDEHPFEPISRDTVSSQVRTQLLHRITTGDLPPGGRMPSERDLSERFQVARTSIREAMQGLLSLGIVERRGNRSYVVEQLPEVVVVGDSGSGVDRKSFVAELFETRRVLEVPIFAMAAERADDTSRARIVAIADEFGDSLDITTFRQLDREFHTTIAAACGNPLLIELYGKVLDRLFRSSEFDELLGAEKNRAEVERIITVASAAHRAIADAIGAGDVDRVRLATESHLDAVKGAMVDDLV